VAHALEEVMTNPKYELHHPKWYRKRLPIFWWLERFSYAKFITRELTSLAVGYTAMLLIAQVWFLSSGEQAYERFLSVLRSPAVLIFHGIVLLFLLFHSITWLNLAPKALVLRVGSKRLPDVAVLAGHYAAWLGATALLVWLVVGI
jgi:fumarate reductase subunit C